MSETVVYPGRDLEAMSFAVNYHRWILRLFRPHLGRRVVEVGAGNGSFSRMLLECSLESLSLVEPAANGYQILRERMAQPPNATIVHTYQAVFSQVAEEIRARQQPDSIIYVNVLEHIQDDQAELRLIRQTLSAKGRLFIFVPALPCLYSEFDRSLGHFRRYKKPELEDKCRRAGFRLRRTAYFDAFGVAPWFIKYRLLKSRAAEPAAVAVYDKFVVPVAQKLETRMSPPIGKNILLIAEKD
jgi:SAM-dependent methyltransferase